MIEIKDGPARDRMRKAGKAAGSLLAELRAKVRAGLTTRELDQFAEEVVGKLGGIPAFKGYRGYPATICASVNDVVVHGIPGALVLEEGDILSLDVGVILEGYYGDTAATVAVGAVSEERKKLIRVTEESLGRGIAAVRSGGKLGAIGHAVQVHAEGEGFSVVRDFVGHGIGRRLHEEPRIPNYGPADAGVELQPGMTLAIEPMVNAGGPEVKIDRDGWTARTRDGSLSAHFEHTILITEDGVEVLTAEDR